MTDTDYVLCYYVSCISKGYLRIRSNFLHHFCSDIGELAMIKLLCALLCLASISNAFNTKSPPIFNGEEEKTIADVAWSTFEQPLDHSNSSNSLTIQQVK